MDKNNFDAFAIELFSFQYISNPLYRHYCQLLGRSPRNVSSLFDIPFLPIEFFKSHSIKSGSWEPRAKFLSSGTTSMQRSAHLVDDPDFYLNNTVEIFESSYGPLNQYMVAALLPSYQQQGNSSLIAMVDHFIKKTSGNKSGYFLEEGVGLRNALRAAMDRGNKVLLIGVTYALLDIAESGGMDLKGAIIMETGGMKGRRQEIVRDELHNILCNAFNVSEIHSEYGMTELLSQAYSLGGGRFHLPRTMKLLIRDINDPYSYLPSTKSGGINVVDLANIHSVAFIETKDIGIENIDGTIMVLGRYDNSDIRGCNLLL